MSKKTHDHKQLRALEKQRRIDRVSHKDEPGLSIRVPKLCRESLLYDLSRDFYRLTGVDIFIGIPANIQNGPQTETVNVVAGQEAILVGAQMSQLYAVCFNAALKNACAEPDYSYSSIEILLSESPDSDRIKWESFLSLVAFTRQFFCYYAYMWPDAVPDQGLRKLKHYLDVCSEKAENCGTLPQQLIEQQEGGWLQLQEYMAQTADELYAWLENIAHTRGNEPANPGTWKKKIALLYKPTKMSVLTRKNWEAPLRWRQKKYQLNLRDVTLSSDISKLEERLIDYIDQREAGLPTTAADFVFLQDQICYWADTEMRRQYYRPSHAKQNSKFFCRE